ncbi:MAG: hypothetical protein IKZ86_10135 [Spirochaetaceae bacterium]|nr:hypothetical protein [Spirochaetaceae bacterium]
MDIKERLKKITEYWFLIEPLLFAAYCTHELVQNDKMKIPFRTGLRKIEYNPNIIEEFSDEQIMEYLKIEVIRILLKHPYQRLSPFPNRKVLTYASNITIADCHQTNIELPGVDRWPLPKNLCFEEYYDMVFAILSTPPVENGNSGETIIPPDFKVPPSDDEDADSSVEQVSELWEEDEETCCDINNLMEMAEISCTWGSLSGKLQSMIKASMKIEMDYRKMLSIFRTSILSSKRTLTRMRPSRRFGFANMGSRYELAANLLIAVDVSGSVSDQSLQYFFSVINRFFKYGIEKLDVIQFDHELKTDKPKPLNKARNTVKIIGRGGTSFQPAADYYCTHPEYDGLIYFTDGYAPPPVFNTKRPIDVLWILQSKNEYKQHKNWIKSIDRNRATYIPRKD